MPLVADPNYADAFVMFDVHNVVGRCDKGPAGVLRNRFNYPTTSIHIGLAKVRLATMLADVKRRKVCIVTSAQENSNVRRAHYPEYKANRPPREQDHYIIAGKRQLKYRDGFVAEFDYETDDLSMLSHPDLVGSGFVPPNKPTYKIYDGVRDFMEAMSCIPSCTIEMPNNDGETDDALATFSHLARPKPCWIVTEDRDIWACMSDRVKLVSKPDKIYTLSSLEDKFGIVEPAKLPLAKALYGDDSDNVSKPVANVTEKSVGALLRRCKLGAGERTYTPCFMREVYEAIPSAKGRDVKTLNNLLTAAQEVERLERIMRLRSVELSYTHNKRDLPRLESILDWCGIVNKDKTLEFARM